MLTTKRWDVAFVLFCIPNLVFHVTYLCLVDRSVIQVAVSELHFDRYVYATVDTHCLEQVTNANYLSSGIFDA
jgi:hypothetical protein